MFPPEIAARIKNQPNTCPFCNVSQLDAYPPTLCLDDHLRMKVTCLKCGQSWVEVHAFSMVESVGEYEES